MSHQSKALHLHGLAIASIVQIQSTRSINSLKSKDVVSTGGLAFIHKKKTKKKKKEWHC